MELLRNRNIAYTAATVVCFASCMFAMVFFLPVYMQLGLGTTPAHAGLMILPLTFGIVTGSTLTGRIISKTGKPKWIPVAGLSLAGTALLAMGILPPLLPVIGAVGYCCGLGFGTVMPTSQVVIQTRAGRARPRHRLRHHFARPRHRFFPGHGLVRRAGVRTVKGHRLFLAADPGSRSARRRRVGVSYRVYCRRLRRRTGRLAGVAGGADGFVTIRIRGPDGFDLTPELRDNLRLDHFVRQPASGAEPASTAPRLEYRTNFRRLLFACSVCQN